MSAIVCLSCADEKKRANCFISVLVMILIISSLMIIVSTGVLVTGMDIQQNKGNVQAAARTLEASEEKVNFDIDTSDANDILNYDRDPSDANEAQMKNDSCTLVYTAVQPNFVGQKTPVATLSRNICKQRKPSKGYHRSKPGSIKSRTRISSSVRYKLTRAERKKRKKLLRRARRRHQHRLKSINQSRDSRELLEQQSQTVGGADQDEVKKLKQLFVEGEQYRNWKRRKSVEMLLKQPQAQLAIEQLWQRLIRSGDQWKIVYKQMHNRTFPFSLEDEITKEDITAFNLKNYNSTDQHIIPHDDHYS